MLGIAKHLEQNRTELIRREGEVAPFLVDAVEAGAERDPWRPALYPGDGSDQARGNDVDPPVHLKQRG